MKPLISIVVPVYNSQDCLWKLYEEVDKQLSLFASYELILVNDKSRDKSWDVIVEISSQKEHVVGVSLRKNSGQDNAIMAGLRIAKGEYIVIMDDDLQHSPSDISVLYSKCKEGYDVCFALFTDKQQKVWKNMGSWLNGKLSEKLLSKPKEIYLSPFKIIKREVILEAIKYSGPFPYLDAIILSITSNLTQVEIEHHKRFRGKSNYSLFRSFSVFVKHATGFSIFPLRLVTFIGLFFSFISFILGLFYLVDYFYEGTKVEGWVTLVLLWIFIGGLMLMSVGIIGEYVGRIYLSINNKPQYTIDRIVSKEK